MYMYVCIYTFMYVYFMYACMHACIYVCILYVHVYICMYVRTYVRAYAYFGHKFKNVLMHFQLKCLHVNRTRNCMGAAAVGSGHVPPPTHTHTFGCNLKRSKAHGSFICLSVWKTMWALNPLPQDKRSNIPWLSLPTLK